jgi:hypothetical protein
VAFTVLSPGNLTAVRRALTSAYKYFTVSHQLIDCCLLFTVEIAAPAAAPS